MEDVREIIVSLWANVINREITRIGYWFLKDSSWKDIDIVGIKPGSSIISLYNVKSNLNTDSKKNRRHSPEEIAINFTDAITTLNNGYDRDFKYNLYLIFESADRLGSRTGCKNTQEYLEKIKEKSEAYRNDIQVELHKKNINTNNFTLKSLFECVKEIKLNVKKSPTGTGGHCFELKNGIFVNPFHKIPVLKILDIYTDYNF